MQRIGIFAGIAIAILVAAWFLLIFRPESKKLSTAHQAKAAAEQKASQLQDQVQSLDHLVTLVPADKTAFAGLQQHLPDNPQLPAALDQLQADALSTGVQLQSVNPTAPAAPGSSGQTASGPAAITFAITAVGSYQQDMAFLTTLNNSARTFVTDHLSLAGGGTGRLNMSMSVRMFYAGQPTP